MKPIAWWTTYDLKAKLTKYPEIEFIIGAFKAKDGWHAWSTVREAVVDNDYQIPEGDNIGPFKTEGSALEAVSVYDPYKTAHYRPLTDTF